MLWERGNMGTDYFLAFDEPDLLDRDIKCAFCISNIERKRGFFFIIEEDNKLILYYMLVKISDYINLAAKYCKKDDDMVLENIITLPAFRNEYNRTYLKTKEIDNQAYVKETINRMSKDNICNAKNDVLGLDGFSVELKLNKLDDVFYAWRTSNDKKYYYVIDFINYILDEASIAVDYRFEKFE